MILKLKEFQEVCKNILEAVDESGADNIGSTLELIASNGKISLNVTNKEYFVTMNLPSDSTEDFHASISASLFLKLIAKTTTDTITLTIKDNALCVEGNGTYSFPLIFDEDRLLELPRINIDEVTNEFTVNISVLQNIMKYNAKELQKSGIRNPVQKMFYIDEQGAITFASGACVNEFTLDSPVRLLLSEKVVKLFKLFTTETVNISVGFTSISESLTQTKIRLYNDNVILTAITNNDASLINSVPAKVIRGIANNVYTNKIIFNKQEVLDALDRLSIFTNKDTIIVYSFLTITGNELTIFDARKQNKEKILLEQSNVEDTYECILNTNDFKITLDSQKEEFVTMRFGNHRSIVIELPSIRNVLPECKAN